MNTTVVQRKGLAKCRVDTDLAAGRLGVHLSELAPGACAHAAHTHEGVEAFYVLEGKASVEVDAASHQVGANEVLMIDAQKLHAISNSGETTLRYLVIISRA
jgi:mannose-6-phosphate isomerase-like protein (cupin superfamily)